MFYEFRKKSFGPKFQWIICQKVGTPPPPTVQTFSLVVLSPTFLVDSINVCVMAIRSLLFRAGKFLSISFKSKLSVVLRLLNKRFNKLEKKFILKMSNFRSCCTCVAVDLDVKSLVTLRHWGLKMIEVPHCLNVPAQIYDLNLF